MTDFQSLVEQKLEPVSESGNDVIYRCPQCDDSSGHLYVNYNKQAWHCFKCNAGGRRIESLLRLLNISVDYDYDRLYSDHDKELESIISSKKKYTPPDIVDYSTNLSILTEYYKLHTTPLSNNAYEYLINRGISTDSIQTFRMCEGVNRYGDILNIAGREYVGRDYSGRIMIPSLRRDGLISFYVGRDYIGDKSSKYLNPPKEIAIASEDVWNLDIIETPNIVICEGVMTAIAINQALGKNIACATYGKSISQKSSNIDMCVTSQGEKLLSKKFLHYILFYDKDAHKESRSTAEYLHDRGATVKVVNITTDKYGAKADAADMTEEEIIQHIMDSQYFDKFYGML